MGAGAFAGSALNNGCWKGPPSIGFEGGGDSLTTFISFPVPFKVRGWAVFIPDVLAGGGMLRKKSKFRRVDCAGIEGVL